MSFVVYVSCFSVLVVMVLFITIIIIIIIIIIIKQLCILTQNNTAFDISVTSPLNALTMLEAGVSAGSAARVTEDRKHKANDAKCDELGWLCVPLVSETYGAWGKEAMETFSQLVSRLATLTCRPKSMILSDIYGRLNLHLVRANATAILTRCVQS